MPVQYVLFPDPGGPITSCPNIASRWADLAPCAPGLRDRF